MEERVLEFDVSSATVALAAEALHCEPCRIAKTLSFMLEDKPILILTAGDRKISNPKYKAQFDFALSTVPYEYEIAPYIALVKPFANFTIVGMPVDFSQKLPTLLLSSTKVNVNASLIGGMKETQEMADFCAKSGVRPNIQKITAAEINQAWKDIVAKKARYRVVIDPKSF